MCMALLWDGPRVYILHSSSAASAASALLAGGLLVALWLLLHISSQHCSSNTAPGAALPAQSEEPGLLAIQQVGLRRLQGTHCIKTGCCRHCVRQLACWLSCTGAWLLHKGTPGELRRREQVSAQPGQAGTAVAGFEGTAFACWQGQCARHKFCQQGTAWPARHFVPPVLLQHRAWEQTLSQLGSSPRAAARCGHRQAAMMRFDFAPSAVAPACKCPKTPALHQQDLGAGHRGWPQGQLQHEGG